MSITQRRECRYQQRNGPSAFGYDIEALSGSQPLQTHTIHECEQLAGRRRRLLHMRGKQSGKKMQYSGLPFLKRTVCRMRVVQGFCL